MKLLGMPTPLREADLEVERYRGGRDLKHMVRIRHRPTNIEVIAGGPTEVRAGAAALLKLHLRLKKLRWEPKGRP